MRVLLLGPNGQLGSDITAAAAAMKGVEIILCPRDQLDVTDVDAVADVLEGFEADWVLNTTSYHLTDEVEDNADKAVAVNAHGVAALAKACKAQNKRFLTISTDYVFGAETRETPYVETDAPAPINVYGATKVMGESLATFHNPDSVIVRVASLFGVTGPSGKGDNFVEVMLRLAKDRKSLNVVNDQIMGPTYTVDAAVALLKLMQADAAGGIYHCTGSGQASWFDLAKAAIETVGIGVDLQPIPSSGYPTRATRPGYTVLDGSKLADIAGAMPDWHDGLKRYLLAKGHIG